MLKSGHAAEAVHGLRAYFEWILVKWLVMLPDALIQAAFNWEAKVIRRDERHVVWAGYITIAHRRFLRLAVASATLVRRELRKGVPRCRQCRPCHSRGMIIEHVL